MTIGLTITSIINPWRILNHQAANIQIQGNVEIINLNIKYIVLQLSTNSSISFNIELELYLV